MSISRTFLLVKGPLFPTKTCCNMSVTGKIGVTVKRSYYMQCHTWRHVRSGKEMREHSSPSSVCEQNQSFYDKKNYIVHRGEKFQESGFPQLRVLRIRVLTGEMFLESELPQVRSFLESELSRVQSSWNRSSNRRKVPGIRVHTCA
jgi:hypothetical protein